MNYPVENQTNFELNVIWIEIWINITWLGNLETTLYNNHTVTNTLSKPVVVDISSSFRDRHDAVSTDKAVTSETGAIYHSLNLDLIRYVRRDLFSALCRSVIFIIFPFWPCCCFSSTTACRLSFGIFPLDLLLLLSHM